MKGSLATRSYGRRVVTFVTCSTLVTESSRLVTIRQRYGSDTGGESATIGRSVTHRSRWPPIGE